MKILDRYYKRPILYDYSFSIVLICVLIWLNYYDKITLPTGVKSSNLSSDIGAIGLTISGFILTLITILLTLKSGQILSEEKLSNSSSPFKIFLASKMYKRAIDILKYGVYSLVLVSMLIYILRMSLHTDSLIYLFYFNLLGIIIILTTFLRCFHVLGLIMKMQGE